MSSFAKYETLSGWGGVAAQSLTHRTCSVNVRHYYYSFLLRPLLTWNLFKFKGVNRGMDSQAFLSKASIFSLLPHPIIFCPFSYFS